MYQSYSSLSTWNTLNCLTSEESMVFNTFLPKVFAFVSSVKEKFYNVFIVTLFCWKKHIEGIKINKKEVYNKIKILQLTYPSGCNFIKNFLRLKDNFRILAHEKVLIRVMPWKTAIPKWATDRFKGTPSWSFAACIFIPYNSQRRAVSSKFKSASAGDCPL